MNNPDPNYDKAIAQMVHEIKGMVNTIKGAVNTVKNIMVFLFLIALLGFGLAFCNAFLMF